MAPSLNCVSDGNLQGTVTVNVGNIGCGDVNNVVVRLLSTSGIVFPDQTVNLAASANTNLTFNFIPNCTACTCIFIAEIDPDELICECDGTNNNLASPPFTMTVPDIEVQSDILTVTCSGDNQVSLSGTVNLVNNGSIDSYWKYGREPGNTTVHPYEFNLSGGTGAQIMGNTVLLNFIDGQRGDDDLDGGNGIFVDDGGPVSTATGIPAISKEGMIVSIILLFLFAC